MEINEAMEILQKGKYRVMSVVGGDGYPYGVPLHYVMMDGKLYFHCAVDGGHKTDCLNHNPKISFTVIEPQEGMRCRSAIFFGAARPVPEKRAIVLEKIVEKFIPELAWTQAKGGIPFAKDKIEAYEITLDRLTAKFIDKSDGQ